MSSQVPIRELTKQNYYKDGKSFLRLNMKMPAEFYTLFRNIDDAAASFLFEARIDATHQPKIADALYTLKQRCKTLEDFKDKLYDLDGANECLDGDILPTQFQLTGKPVPAECEPCHGVCARALLGVSYVKGSSAPLQRHYHSDYGGKLGRILQN